MKRFGYVCLWMATLVGGWAVFSTLMRGHIVVNTTQHVPWGLWVALYIFFLGLSAGSFLLSTLIYVFGVKRLEPVGPLALLQALGCFLVGGFLIIMDLGHPFRIYKVFVTMNTSSVMAWMGVFYLVFVVIVLGMLRCALRSGRQRGEARMRDARWLKGLGILGIPVAIIMLGGEGAIFAVAKARPNWYGGFLPVIFLISALASGAALLTFLTVAWSGEPRERKLPLVQNLARMMIGILCVDLFLLMSGVFVTLYGFVPQEVIGMKLTLFGPYWWVFWIVQLALGALVPLWIVFSPRRAASVRWLGGAGFLVMLGILGAKLNMVIPPLIAPVFSTLPEAYHHVRNSLGYIPSLHEWLVAVFAFALGIWLLLGVARVLPLAPAGGDGS